MWMTYWRQDSSCLPPAARSSSAAIGSRVTPLVQSGQYRVVAATKAKTGQLRLRTPGE